MTALIPVALSAPARRVEPVEVVNNTTARYSRTLDERHPDQRSSCADIVPMDLPSALHPADCIVLVASLLACLALLGLVLGGLLP